MRGTSLQRRLLLVLSVLFCAGCGEGEQSRPHRRGVDVVTDRRAEVVDAKPVSTSKLRPPQIELRGGEQFHYIKSVQQWLSRPSQAGTESLGEERVRMLMTLMVQESHPDRILLEVVYRQVQYEYEFGGRKIAFSSADNDGVVPRQARPYAGLVDNGFSVWLGRNNRLLDAVGFDEFLRRCVCQCAPGERAELLQVAGGFSGSAEERITAAQSFLDESIALLPFDELRQGKDYFPTGATWSRTIGLSAETAMTQTLQLKLDYIEDDKAHIIIGGTIQPASDSDLVTPEGMRVALSGGMIRGSCEVSLLNGLPGSCRILREFQLEATPLDRPTVTLNKTVETRFDPWEPGASR